MTKQELDTLTDYGKKLDVKVTSVFQDGTWKAAIQDDLFDRFFQAFNRLKYLESQIQDINGLPWAEYQRKDSCNWR